MSLPRAPRPERPVKPIIAGLVVAILGVALTVFLARGQTPASNGSPGATSGPTTSVVVARVSIPLGSKITVAELTTVSEPSNGVPQDAITDVNAPVGQYAGIDISANETIVPGMLAHVAATAPITINPITLADNNVAIAIPNDTLRGAGGYIEQGDHIDIIVDVTGQGDIQYVFQDVPVLRAGSVTQAEGASDVLLVELPRRQAEEMALIANGRGTPATLVRYVIRPSDQDGKGALPSGADTQFPSQAASDPAMTAQQFNSLFGK